MIFSAVPSDAINLVWEDVFPLLGPALFSSYREQVVKTRLYIVAGIKMSDQSKIKTFEKLKKENLKEIKEEIKYR